MDFTPRDDQLLNRLLNACDDYTQDEMLQAVGRMLLHATQNPLVEMNERHRRNLIYEGFVDALHVRETRGFGREEALLLMVGYLQGLLKQPETEGPMPDREWRLEQRL